LYVGTYIGDWPEFLESSVLLNSDEVPDGLWKPGDIQDGLCKMWEEKKAKTEVYYDSLACSFWTVTFW
jgi:hypothetical protein